MTSKSFILSAIAGTITYFLLGWLFYGILFPDIYPNEGQNATAFIFIGCFVYAFLFTYIYKHWASVSTLKGGAVAGLTLGFLYSLSMNFFMYSSKVLNLENFIIDLAIGSITAAIMGGVIGYVLGKTK
jgi:hypothetical protein